MTTIIRSKRFWTSIVAAVFLMPYVAAPVMTNDKRTKHSSTVPMSSAEGKTGSLCVSFSAGMTAPLFEGLERVETPSGTEFRRSKETVKNFPEIVEVQLWAKPYGCKSASWKVQPKDLGADILNSMAFEVFWKHDTELRPAQIISSNRKHFAGANQWFFLIQVRSSEVPLSDHLVLSILTADGTQLTRLSGRL
jgi:hypothetical protein